MSPPIDLNQRVRLLGELRLRQRLFVDVLQSLLFTARDPRRQQGALIQARYQLGVTIRQRRAAIEEILGLPAYTPEARACAAASRDARDRMHAAHLAQLGTWPAVRMEAEPGTLAAELGARLDDLIARADEEAEAAIRFLDHVPVPDLAFPWLTRTAS